MIPETLAHYRILDKLGAGGMGEVYRAHDSKLGRDVAIKLLPDVFSRDPERLARFEREAQLLAALNHPNIAAIYGIEESGGTRFLVLELVQGETLAERIASGPLPLEELAPLALQMAEALEAAHERGIVHRDLKPANLKITPEGKLKVLDFGLAKDFAATGLASDLSQSPTLTALPGGTRAGVVLGTAAYMSPEQARGKPLDRRTDIWSFGCVLYEALAGRQVFSGETSSDTMAAILRAEPDWSALPASTPEKMRGLLRRCLEKDPRRRLRDIGDAHYELEMALAEPAPAVAAPSAADAAMIAAALQRARWRKALPWGVAALMTLVAIGAYWMARRAASEFQGQQQIRFTHIIPPPPSQTFWDVPSVVLSPDGTRVVYVQAEGNTNRLWVRPLDKLEGTRLANTTGAEGPFFSPDGQWVGYFAGGKLMKISVNGGVPSAICDASTSRGGDWGDDGTIVFSPTPGSPILRVPATGGTPQPVTSLDAAKGENSHRWPKFLPGSKSILFAIKTVKSATFDDAQIAVQELGSNVHRVVAEGGSDPRYISSGHLVYARAGSLQAIPFDLKELKATGPAAAILEGVVWSQGTGAAHFTVSASGSLAYVAGGVKGQEQSIMWVDRKGTMIPTAIAKRGFFALNLSPDGKRFVVSVGAANDDVWISEIARGTLTRLTAETGNNDFPLWTPDGNRIVFLSDRNNAMSFYWKRADGTGPEEELLRVPGGHQVIASSFSADGKWLAYTDFDPATGRDLWLLPVTGDRKPQAFLRTPFNEHEGVISPDGKWISYTSNESGRDEVYAQPFPGPGGKVQVSTGGGEAARWAHNGRELFYRNGNKMMVAAYTTSPGFSPQAARLLFEGNFMESLQYGVAADDQRLAMVHSGEQEGTPRQLNVVVNWVEELRRRVPGGKN
jgi:serine/threonine-protein kinase